MTDATFGRALPIHFMMLTFACWSNPPSRDKWMQYDWPPLDHDEKIRQIIQGRANLFYETEEDFGMSLKNWRDFLVGRAERGEEHFGYNHAYSASFVDTAILTMINDPERAALEQEADAAQAYIEPEPAFWWPGESD